MEVFGTNLSKSLNPYLIGILLCFPHFLNAQISKSDSIGIAKVISDFKESIIQKDTLRFQGLFFSKSVDFTGIMSKATEGSIKKDYPGFQGVAVSNHNRFIKDIFKSPKKQEEKFFNILMTSDGAIAAVSFDYAFYSEEKMFQWGNEKWNLAKDGEKWLITDVVFSIHFPDIEPFPLD